MDHSSEDKAAFSSFNRKVADLSPAVKSEQNILNHGQINSLSPLAMEESKKGAALIQS